MKAKYMALVVLLIAAAFSVGRFTGPTKVETVYRESEQTNKNQNVIEVIRETKSPDGTVIKETRKEKETTTSTQRQTDSKSTTETRPSFRIGGAYRPPIKGLQTDNFAVIIEKRIVSEAYLGVMGTLDGTFWFTGSIGF